MNFFEIVGNNIIKILDEKKMMQSTLAEQIGVSRQVIQKIIKGKKAINILELKQIAGVLQVSMDELTNENKVTVDSTSLIMFMGAFANKQNYEFLNTVIEEIIDMEEDLIERGIN